MMNQPDSIREGVEEGAGLVALASHNARDGFSLGGRADEAGAGSSSGNACSSQLGGHAARAPLQLTTGAGVHLHHTALPCASPSLCPASLSQCQCESCFSLTGVTPDAIIGRPGRCVLTLRNENRHKSLS